MSTETNGAPSHRTVLIELEPRGGALDDVRDTAADLLGAMGDGTTMFAAFQELANAHVTIYLTADWDDQDVSGLGTVADERFKSLALGPVSISLLAPRFAIAGASAGSPAPFRYVVHTDVDAGGALELERWYDAEHMPGLAAVPGTVFAQRMLCHRGEAPYFACYDLVAPEVLDSESWLAVRATEWSSRVRPTFRNTRRFMSRRLG